MKLKMPSGIRRYRGATIFDDRSRQQQRQRNLSPNNRAASASRTGSQHHNPYDYGHHYRDLNMQRQMQQEQQYQQHYQQQQQQLMARQQQHQEQEQEQQHHQQQQHIHHHHHHNHVYRRSRNKNSGSSGAKRQHASTSNLHTTQHQQHQHQHQQQHQQHQHHSGHYSDSIGVSPHHVFPVVKLHRRSAHLDDLEPDDQDEYLTKRKVEKKTTKETEKTVKRKILLGDGRVIEDEAPETVRDLVEDTTMKEQEHFDHGRNRGLADRQLTRWKSAGDDIVDDSWRRVTNTRDVQENVTQTAATKDLGMISKRAVDRAIKDKVPVREALEAEKERKRAKQRRRERERERQELIMQRQQRDQLLNYDSGGHYQQQHSAYHDRNNNKSSHHQSRHQQQQHHEVVVARTPEPEVVYSSKKHRRTIDTEDVHNISRRLENGKVLTETYKTEEHEVLDDQEEPDSQSDAPSETHVLRDRQGYSHKKRDEFTDYYTGRGRHLGRGAHATTEERRIEKGRHDWEEISERMRRERERLRQRLAAGESAERKDALTKKPLNYNQEEKTRKKETDKWLERHFGSDWSLTTPSLSSGSGRHRLLHRTLNQQGHGHQNSSMRNTLGVGDAGAGKNGVRRSMSFSSIPVSYTQHPPPGQEINRTQTKTKEKITKTTTTTYKPVAALGFDNKESSQTVTREVPIMHSQTHTQLVTPRSKSATLHHPRHHKSAGNINNNVNNNNNNSGSTRNVNISFETGQSSTLQRHQRDKISPTSPRQYHSTLSLTTPRAEYALDEPLRAPSRLTTARSTGHLLQHQYLPSELGQYSSAEQEILRSRGRRSQRHHEEKRSASANDNPAQFQHSYTAYEEKHTQRSASASSNEDARFGRNSRFAQHIVEERGASPAPRRLVAEDRDSYREKKSSGSSAGGSRRKTPPLYVTEFKQDNLLYPAHSENNLLFSQREYHSLGVNNDENEVHVGRKKSLVSSSLNQQQQQQQQQQQHVDKESLYRHEEKDRLFGGGGGHVSFADRLDRPAHHLTDQQVYTNYSNGRNSSYHGFRSLERNEGLRSKSSDYHHGHGQYGGSEDEEAATSTSSGSKGSSARHRRRARSQSFLVKSTRPQYAYAMRLPLPLRDAPRKGALESDFVYDRQERRFVEDTGMRHGHSDLRLDVSVGSNPQLHLVRQEEMQLEPQKFKTIIFLNGH